MHRADVWQGCELEEDCCHYKSLPYFLTAGVAAALCILHSR